MAVTIVMASNSPRRRELIPLLGISWTARDSGIDESSVTLTDPEALVVEVARRKAVAAAQTALADDIIVGADTTVVLNGEILGKPDGPADAERMLQTLRGRDHQVLTGITVVARRNGRMVRDLASVSVTMREYGSDEIEEYVRSGDPLDKAGAYAIQHSDFRPVSGLTGCYAAVVGLPLCHLARALKQLGVPINLDVASACQAHHAIVCPIFSSIQADPGPMAEWADLWHNSDQTASQHDGLWPAPGPKPLKSNDALKDPRGV